MTSLYKYSYYDTPDGKDLVKKIFYTFKHVSIIGFGIASSEIILLSKPVGYFNTFVRYGIVMGPMYAAASTFCVTTYISTKLRGKDDELNYAISGFTSGALVGILYKRNLLGFVLGISFAIYGAVKKHSKVNNYEFFPTFPVYRKAIHGDFRTPYRNWTIYEQMPKGWIAAEYRKE